MEKRKYWQGGLRLDTGRGLVVWNAWKAAEKAGDLEAARRLRAIHLVGVSHYTQVAVGKILDVTENAVTRWVMAYKERGCSALLSRKPPGSKCRLTDAQLRKLELMVRKGPEAHGFDTGVWDANLVGELVRREFGVEYHPTTIRRILKRLGFSLQYPKKTLAGANLGAQRRWLKVEYPRVKKRLRMKAGSSSSKTSPSSSRRARSSGPGHRSGKALR